ncbi:MAG: DUF4445 domain-containing protein [Chloroflexi bacterium]|nr:DUF4445 domain-containing protein [Chloroflexota bacterium]
MEAEVVTVPRTQSGIDGEVVPYQQDINQLQSAKGAIRAGTHVLLRQAGIEAGQVEQVIIAGAFGSYIDVLSAVCRGLLPALPLERFRQVGNAAGTGARMALVSRRVRRLAIAIARRVRYVGPMTAPGFANGCAQALYLP